MTTTVETVNIDLDTISAEELWKVYLEWVSKEVKIEDSIWKDRKFTNILLSEPQVTSTDVSSDLVVEQSDCFGKLLIRVPTVSELWTVSTVINFWNSDLTWSPDYVELVNEEGLSDYVVNVSELKVFKLVTGGAAAQL